MEEAKIIYKKLKHGKILEKSSIEKIKDQEVLEELVELLNNSMEDIDPITLASVTDSLETEQVAYFISHLKGKSYEQLIIGMFDRAGEFYPPELIYEEISELDDDNNIILHKTEEVIENWTKRGIDYKTLLDGAYPWDKIDYFLERDMYKQITYLPISTNTGNDDSLKKLIEKWPSDMEIPSIIASDIRYIDDKADRLSLAAIIDMLYENNVYSGFIVSHKQELKDRIIELCSKENDFNTYRISRILNRGKGYIKNYLDEETLNTLIPYLINKGCFIDYSYGLSKEQENIVINNYIEYRNNKRYNNFQNDKYNEPCNLNPADFDLSEEQVLEFCKSGAFKGLCPKYNDILHKHEQEIIEIIKNYPNTKICLMEEISFELLSNVPNILFALYERYGYSKADFNLYSGYSVTVLTEETIDGFIKLMNKFPNMEINFRDRIKYDKRLFDEFIKHGQFKLLLNNLKSAPLTEDLFGEEILFTDYVPLNIIIDKVTNDADFAETIITDQALCKKIFTSDLIDPYLTNKKYVQILLNRIEHDENLIPYLSESLYNKLKPYLAIYENIDIDKLNKLESLMGPIIVTRLDNINIKQYLELPKEQLDRMIELFKSRPYTLNDLEAGYDSLKQYEFGKKNPDIMEINTRIMQAIEANNEYLLDVYLTQVESYIDKEFIEGLKAKYKLDKLDMNTIVDNIRKTNDPLYIDILHDITSYYIGKNREEYRKKHPLLEEVKLPYRADEKAMKKGIFLGILDLANVIDTQIPKAKYNTAMGEISEKYTLLEYIYTKVEDKMSYEQFKNTVAYLTKKELSPEDAKEATRHIKPIMQALGVIYALEDLNKLGLTETILKNIKNEGLRKGTIPKEYYVEDHYRIEKILLDMNGKSFIKNVLNNEEAYQSLKELMESKKLCNLPNVLEYIAGPSGVNIMSSFVTVPAFIGVYGSIYKKIKGPEDDKKQSLSELFASIEAYCGISKRYSRILGQDDAELIKQNPGPNTASSKTFNNERLNEAVSLTPKLFERQTIPVPPIVKEYPTNSGQLRAVVGNFTDPCNLTHGERTGACMRIGGAGETLFYFILKDPNGFHIRFEDPKNNKYVSRVSGFRNGNTVFLNELRFSTREEYSDEDVIEACKQVAEDLIEQSKDSKYPIENVFAYAAYALHPAIEAAKQFTEYNFEDINIKEGLEDDSFYSDINKNGVLLATNAKEKYTPIKIGADKVERYQVARGIPLKIESVEEMSQRISRIEYVKAIEEGTSGEYVTDDLIEEGIKIAYASDDWYIYVDSSGIIHEATTNTDKRAVEELAQYHLKVLEELSDKEKKEEDSYGL